MMVISYHYLVHLSCHDLWYAEDTSLNSSLPKDGTLTFFFIYNRRAAFCIKEFILGTLIGLHIMSFIIPYPICAQEWTMQS